MFFNSNKKAKKRQVILSNSTTASYEICRKVIAVIFHDVNFEFRDMTITFTPVPRESGEQLEVGITTKIYGDNLAGNIMGVQMKFMIEKYHLQIKWYPMENVAVHCKRETWSGEWREAFHSPIDGTVIDVAVL